MKQITRSKTTVWSAALCPSGSSIFERYQGRERANGLVFGLDHPVMHASA